MNIWQDHDSKIAAIIGGCFIVVVAIVSYSMVVMNGV